MLKLLYSIAAWVFNYILEIMAQILRQIVAGPRIKHPETGLDLVYVTDNIIAMSMPAASGPKLYYRNPLHKVVEFLEKEHGSNWAVWEFRAEGTGYDDSAFHNRVFHSPWPDHHPPPFALIPNIMASMRNHLKQSPEKVAVVHCKAGKGRTGTVTCSYLISEEGWSKEDALERFTKKRMRPQFGAGVSIPSQLRYVDYVSRWVSEYSKIYVERSVEIPEVHIWGLRENVKIAILGYVDEGKTIKNFHSFRKDEKLLVDADEEKNSQMVIYKPKNRVVLPTNDVCIDLEKRTKAAAGWTFVSALAHCWWNCYFEGGGAGTNSGVFTQEWDKMDGLKGTLKKGIRIFDKIQIVWKVVEDLESHTIGEPAPGEPVPGTHKASENRGETTQMDPLSNRDLGLRPANIDDDASSSSGGGLLSASKPGSLTNSMENLVLKDKADAEREYRGGDDDGSEGTDTDSLRPSDSVSVTAAKPGSTSTTGVNRSLARGEDSISSPSTANWTTSDSSISTTAHHEPMNVNTQQTLPLENGQDDQQTVQSGHRTHPSNSSVPTITTTPPPQTQVDQSLQEESTPKQGVIAVRSDPGPSTEGPLKEVITGGPDAPRVITASTGHGEVLVSTEPEGDAKLGHKVGRLVQADPKEMAN
ncbi:Telomerase protein component 1, variant 2 [Orbilia oligospora]|uniref:phosphatidylinositol-3,4,5-trisphosphate 3-phosphatase n=3 Tax=Orbilia oligospora TaxID=2813651 RepID=A0A7C8JBK5_ORBOL|nr:Telomerase protein component 1, variant 2 [Orbilia oligospora]KAF3111176.1 Telomerase protein component 1, variant 2 [Orbilia oligospora]KAF3115670.1 Telomerase protein component 1, variant 2 [Orbilia oligospora]KAF3121995.1 Telomerase protein component 1, variant 2 [Orbilia oligospora]KAF3149168.1 Telomerase protein component 1, variant 2 [Orbilia oligospora]